MGVGRDPTVGESARREMAGVGVAGGSSIGVIGVGRDIAGVRVGEGVAFAVGVGREISLVGVAVSGLVGPSDVHAASSAAVTRATVVIRTMVLSLNGDAYEPADEVRGNDRCSTECDHLDALAHHAPRREARS